MPIRTSQLRTPSFVPLAVILLLCLLRPNCGLVHADCQPLVEPTFTVILPKVTNPPDPLNWNLPPVWGPLNSEVGPFDSITVPNGRPIYALMVSGYTRNRFFDELLVYRFARHLMDQGAYVHWAWWNNLLAPYLERPLHHSQSYPGSAVDITSFGSASAAELKAMPGENYQFLSDAKLFLQAIRQHNPEAVIVLVGHSMGGHSVAQLANETDVLIDLVAPIDPVANRTYPWTTLKNQHHYNWTRYRATRETFNGYRSMTWDGGPFFGECVPTGPWKKSWQEASTGSIHPNCLGMVHVHGAPHMTFGSNIINLHHRWQHEHLYPFDYADVRLFNPNYPKPPGGTQSQVAVATQWGGPDPGGWPVFGGNECCPSGDGWAWDKDGHGEIIGARGPAPFLKGLGFQVRTSPECGSDDPCDWGVVWPARTWTAIGGYTNGNVAFRVQLLKDLETASWNPQNPSGDLWPHRPHESALCLVSADLVAKFDSMNKPPIADAGGDQVIECDGCASVVVTLDGSGSFDPDGFALQYKWTGPFGTAPGAVVHVQIPVGIHCITLEVKDSVGHVVRDHAVVSAIDGSATVVPFISAAGPWQEHARNHAAYAFDEFYPGAVGSTACLLDSPLEPAVLTLAGGTMTVSAHVAGAPYCAITDSSSADAASDARINNQNAVLLFEFDPPVTAFYTYFGSLAVSHTATISVFEYAGAPPLGAVTTLPSMDSILASGLGFTASVPVQRIELTATEPGPVMVGAFVGLLPNEQSLGKVHIPSYPESGLVDFDFGVVFTTVCPADLTGNGQVGVGDLLALLAAWGSCPNPEECPADLTGNGSVGVGDLLVLLAAWGPCP